MPPLQAVFQTVPLSLGDWVYIICITSSVLILDELRKLWNSARSSKQGLVPALLSRVCGRGRKRLRYGYARVKGASTDDYKRTDAMQPDTARAPMMGGTGSPRRPAAV